MAFRWARLYCFYPSIFLIKEKSLVLSDGKRRSDPSTAKKTLCGKRGGAALLLWFLRCKMACLSKRTGKYMNEVHLDARSEIRIRTSARFCPWGVERAFVHFPGWSRCTFVTLSMHFCGGNPRPLLVWCSQGWYTTTTYFKKERNIPWKRKRFGALYWHWRWW